MTARDAVRAREQAKRRKEPVVTIDPEPEPEEGEEETEETVEESEDDGSTEPVEEPE